MADVKLNIITNFSDAVKGTKDLTNSMDNLNKETEQYNENVKKSMNSAVNATQKQSREIKRQDGLIEDLENTIKGWKEELRKATNTKDIEKYNRKIAEGRKDLEEYKKKGVPALKDVNKQATVGTKIFSNLGSTIAAAFSIGVITRFIKESLKAYDAQEKAEAKLLTALKGRQSVQRNLIIQSRELQKTTIFGDVGIIEAQANLAKLLGDNEETISQLTPLVLDLASAYKFSLATASDLVAKSIGSGTNALSRYGIIIKGAVGSSERLQSAINELNRVVGGQAVAAAEAGIGSTQQLANTWEDFTQNMGEGINTIWKPLAKILNKILEGFNEDAEESKELADDLLDFIIPDDLRDLTEEQADIYKKHLEGQLKDQREYAKTAQGVFKVGAEATIMATETMLDELIRVRAIGSHTIEDLQKKNNIALRLLMEQGNEDARKIINERYRDYRKTWEELEKLQKEFKDAEGFDLKLSLENQIKEHKDYLKELEEIYGKPINLRGLRTPTGEDVTPMKRITTITQEEGEKQISAENLKYRKLEDSQEEWSIKYVDGYSKTIDQIIKESERLRVWQEANPFWTSLGIDTPEKLKELEKFASVIKSSVDSITQAWVENTERVVDTLNTRIAEQQRAIEIEAQLAADGKANSLAVEKTKLRELQSARERALKEQEKALKTQQGIEGALQAAKLGTAAANIIANYSAIPFAGVALAATVIAGILSLFKTFKSNAGELTKYAEGGEIKGRSHAQGGVKVPGMGIELEGGEYVINKKAYAKYPDLVEAINKDNFRVKHDHLDVKVADQNVSLRETKEIKEIRDILKRLENQPRVEYYDGYRIETFGNVRRRIG